jgi:hypothetical protein
MSRLYVGFLLTLLFAGESAKAMRLKNELAECKSDYANLEAMAAKAKRLHARRPWRRSTILGVVP